jgi:serine phosphatase RsbU (regulator of sigma subunit)/Tfp pilus assembly protein PilF
LKRFTQILVFIAAFSCCGIFLRAQTPVIDSLYTVLGKTSVDSLKVDVMNAIGKEYTNNGDYEKARGIVEDGKDISDKISYQKGLADYYSNMGVIYYYDGNISEALNSNFSALKIRETIGDKKGIASSYNNLAILYNYQGNRKEALRYLLPALQIKEDLGDKKAVVSTYNNIGMTYSDDKNYSEALKYLKKALKTSEETGNKKGLGNAYQNIGLVFFAQEQFDTALVYFTKALAFREEIGSKSGMVSSLVSTGQTYTGLKQFPLAHANLERGLTLAQKIGDKDGIKNSYQGLSELGEAEGNFENAFSYYKLFREAEDSLKNDENTKKSTRAEMNYLFEKKQAEQDKKDALLEEQAKKDKLKVYFVSGILLLVIVFAVFAYRSLIQKRNANRELDSKNQKIEQAYKIIENKNQEITDSINYAQRIQQAILPAATEIPNYFPESFVFYRPKDIVGGDFYYFSKQNNSCFLATADCTGHGVPGAFMSLIGSKELQIANGLSDSPGKILQLLNVGLKETLKQNNLAGTKDGMDIALMSLEWGVRSSEYMKLRYAGANRPLWILRAGGNEIEEIKPTKNAIGGYTEDSQVFAEHEFEFAKGDNVYIFTDGYSDQFGGKNSGKKMTTKRFRELLLSVKNKSMREQGTAVENYFDEWKNDLEQLDDILVIGIRF